MVNNIEIDGRWIGSGHPCFVVAEAGVNHNGDVDLAHKLVEIAYKSGADAVKFQTFKTERALIKSAPKAAYQVETTGSHDSQFDMVKNLELPESAFKSLATYAEQLGITFLSSPFDNYSVNVLGELGVPAFKIPSGEITNLSLMELAASWNVPLIVSTGMATISEIETAVDAIQNVNDSGIVLLQCVSNYPADPSDINLRAMLTMSKVFDLPVGYSDHTLGIEVPLAAVALGACVVEKHFTLDSDMDGPDHRASLEPEDLKAMIQGIRKVELSLGSYQKKPVPSEENTAAVARKSIVADRFLPAGCQITRENITLKRPGTGLSPYLLPTLMGRIVKVDVPEDSIITWEMLDR